MASGFAFFTIMLRRASLAFKSCRQTGQGRNSKRFAGAGEQMVRLERFGLREPEIGNLREHLALARDAVGHDHVERREAVGGDEQQAVAEVEDFAHLAALEFFDAGQFELQDRFVI